MTIIELIKNLLSEANSVNKKYIYLNYNIDIFADKKNEYAYTFKIEVSKNKEKHKDDKTYYSLFNNVHIIAYGLIIDNIDSCSLIVSIKDGNTEYLDSEENKEVEYSELKNFILKYVSNLKKIV